MSSINAENITVTNLNVAFRLLHLDQVVMVLAAILAINRKIVMIVMSQNALNVYLILKVILARQVILVLLVILDLLVLKVLLEILVQPVKKEKMDYHLVYYCI